MTQKQVQITPNAPRFLRPGDSFTFPAKFSNLTDYATSGTAQLFLFDAATGQDITSQLLKGPAQQPVSGRRPPEPGRGLAAGPTPRFCAGGRDLPRGCAQSRWPPYFAANS